jgi:hypothetical protein
MRPLAMASSTSQAAATLGNLPAMGEPLSRSVGGLVLGDDLL